MVCIIYVCVSVALLYMLGIFVYIGLLWANYSPIVEELNLEYETTFVQFGLS